MSRGRYLSFLVLGVALLLVVQASLAFAKSPNKILEWGTMVGVPTGLTGAQSLAPLRGINGGGVPWTLTRGQGQLKIDGSLEIEVDGLVLATTGSNPSAVFRGLVSCVTATGAFQNILTDAFPATTGLASEGGGDAVIETTVALPSPCIAPIVFVTSNGGSWFAATGN
jgi:hypothetical protein